MVYSNLGDREIQEIKQLSDTDLRQLRKAAYEFKDRSDLNRWCGDRSI